jgi:D-arabinose 5-phosphate isomerase GutQ
MAEIEIECLETGLMTPGISRNNSSVAMSCGQEMGAAQSVGVEVTTQESSIKHQLQMRDEFPIRGYKRRRTVSFSQVFNIAAGDEFASEKPFSSQPTPSIAIQITKPPPPTQPAVSTPPITPPASPEDPYLSTLLSRATHILSTEATALSALTRLYLTDPSARAALTSAVEAVTQAVTSHHKNKLVACAVGKSAFVARKLVAMMTSLGVRSSFMHAAEAVHGDLGGVEPGDVVLFVSFSGKTGELLDVAKHLPSEVTVVALTGWGPKMPGDTCPLLRDRRVVGYETKSVDSPGSEADEACDLGILLPAPIHESEESTFGVSAPTTSTTVAMAVCDMLALTVAERIHDGRCAEVFKRHHPGGAIGARMKS